MHFSNRNVSGIQPRGQNNRQKAAKETRKKRKKKQVKEKRKNSLFVNANNETIKTNGNYKCVYVCVRDRQGERVKRGEMVNTVERRKEGERHIGEREGDGERERTGGMGRETASAIKEQSMSYVYMYLLENMYAFIIDILYMYFLNAVNALHDPRATRARRLQSNRHCLLE